MYDEPTARTQLRIPLQAAPVCRSPGLGGAFGDADGIEAAGFWDTLKSIGSTVLQSAPEWAPIAASFL
jgi:hypothetical protein